MFRTAVPKGLKGAKDNNMYTDPLEQEYNDVGDVQERLPSFRVGEYLLAVQLIKRFKANSPQARGARFFMMECAILESQGADANPAGTQAKIMEDEGKPVTAKKIAAIVKALAGEALPFAEASKLWSDENPAKGTKVRLKVERKPLKNPSASKSKDGCYNHYTWFHVPEMRTDAPAADAPKAKAKK
jgi:hypothetical protein